MKKVIIIGATSGIGKALAELYHSKGCIVGVTGRRTVLLEELKEKHPNIHTKAFDVLSPDSTHQLQSLIDEMGGLDVAVISSGIGKINTSLDWGVENDIAQTNVLGFTRMADFLFSYFEAKGHGHLAAISSIASVRGIDLCPAYSASKAYVSVYLEALRRKVKQEKLKGVRVSTIIPGFIDTPLLSKDTPTFWKADVQTAVKQIYSSLQRKRRKIYVTRRWRWVAMFLRVVPSAIYERVPVGGKKTHDTRIKTHDKR